MQEPQHGWRFQRICPDRGLAPLREQVCGDITGENRQPEGFSG